MRSVLLNVRIKLVFIVVLSIQNNLEFLICLYNKWSNNKLL